MQKIIGKYTTNSYSGVATSMLLHLALFASFMSWYSNNKEGIKPLTVSITIFQEPATAAPTISPAQREKIFNSMLPEIAPVEKKVEPRKVQKPVAKQMVEPTPQPIVEQQPLQQPVPVSMQPAIQQAQLVEQPIQQPAYTPPAQNNLYTQYNSIEPSYGSAAPAMPANGFDQHTGTPEVIENPRLRNRVEPSYPKNAVERGQQGVVIVEAVVNSGGFPMNTKVYKSSGHRLLDLAAMNAVEKWEFDIHSQRDSVVRVPVEFYLN